MDPITPTPSTTISKGSRQALLISGALVLLVLIALVGRQLLRTDIVNVSDSTITLSTDKLIYRTSSGSTVPVTVAVQGVTKDAPLVALKLTLDGLPENVILNEKEISGSGSTVIGRARVQRTGSKAIILVSDIEVVEDGPFLTLPLQVTADIPSADTSVVQTWSDPETGSAFISQVAIREGDNYVAHPIESGPLFRLSKQKCTARPACLDADPACKIMEPAEGWCPTPTSTPTLKCPELPQGCDVVTEVDGCTVCATDGGFAAMCPYCASGRQGAICPQRNGTYGYTCVAADTVTDDTCFTCPVVPPAPTDCPLVQLADGTITHVCPSPTATPTPTPTPVCPAGQVRCNGGCISETADCASPTPTISPTPTVGITPTPTGSGSTITPTPTGSSTPSPIPSPSPTTAPVQCSLPLRGDVNCDGRITIADLVLLADFLAGKAQLSESQISNANVAETAQGRVNLADAAAFVMFLTGQSLTL